MRRFILPFSLLALSAFAGAQESPLVLPYVENSCPINFGAQVNGRAIARTVEDQNRHGNSPLLDLTFKRLDGVYIVSASVTVHGTSSGSVYLPVDQGVGKVATQTFELARQQEGAGLSHAAVYVDKMSLVKWSEITELKFADGVVWHATANSHCRARINLLRLVDATMTRLK
jgi:hypothetical protein